MVEPKVSLSLLIPGANLLTSGFYEKNPQTGYDKHKVFIEYIKGKGKNKKKIKETLIVKTRKQSLVTQNINMTREAYEYMLETPTSTKLSKGWNNLSIDIRLRHHFDLIAHDFGAKSYSYEILGD